MKTYFLLILTLAGYFSNAQQAVSAKPKYVIVINDEIVTKEKLNDLSKQGYVKQMKKGVTEEERNKLAERFGDQIGEKEFIIKVVLFTEEEKKEKDKGSKAAAVANDSVKNDRASFVPANEVAKDFSVTMLDGKTIKLSGLKGKVVLLNFWATWCAPCLMEFYDMPSKIIEPFKGSRFVFLPVSKGETKEKVAEKMNHLKKDGISFNVGLDTNEAISKLYNAEPIPKNILIDKNGVIRWIATGNAEGNLDRLAAEIKKLLAE